MTGNCTHECTEYGHSDACWMPGQPSPNHKASKPPGKLSTFVPYQEREAPEQLANGSPKPGPVEERSGGGSGGGGGGSKGSGLRFLPPYSSAYSAASEPSRDCAVEEIPMSPASEYQSATTPSSQASKREIYL